MKKRDRIAKKRKAIAERRRRLRFIRGQVPHMASDTLRPKAVYALNKAIRLERAPNGSWITMPSAVVVVPGIEGDQFLEFKLIEARNAVERLVREGISSARDILSRTQR